MVAPIVRKVSPSKIDLGSNSREAANHPMPTTTSAQPTVAPVVRRRGRPPTIRHEMDTTNMEMSRPVTHNPSVKELEARLPTLYNPMRRRNIRQKQSLTFKEQDRSNEYFDEQSTASAVIERSTSAKSSATANRDLNKAIADRINN